MGCNCRGASPTSGRALSLSVSVDEHDRRVVAKHCKLFGAQGDIPNVASHFLGSGLLQRRSLEEPKAVRFHQQWTTTLEASRAGRGRT